MLVCINVFSLSQTRLYQSNLATGHSLEPLCFAYNTAWSLPGGRGGTPIWNRRGCSSEILNLTPKGDQSGRGLSKF